MAFKVGDIVEPLRSSNSRYAVTNKRRGWVGCVTRDEGINGQFRARTYDPSGSHDFSLESKYFKLRDKIKAVEL